MKKVYKRQFFVTVILMLLLSLTGFAQQIVVTGTISDETGTKVPGANVIVKGTTNGTVSDADGKFSIQAGANDVLVISFIGYQAQEIPVNNRTVIDATLQPDISQLTEVVVIGYGVQKKALNTGANLQVKGEDLEKLSTTNALQALQGQAPGVQITSTSGQPGEPIRVVIRGQGSISNSAPLYVVDGVLTSDISYLNNSDIQSIDVLKDAASAAIYGSQAANGVVIITTKKGKSGHAQITFDSYYGVQNVARKVPLLNAQQYATMLNEASVNSGQAPIYSNDSIAKLGAGTNWLKKMLADNAPTRNYSLGVSGGNETSVYSASLAYTSQAGIIGGKSLSNYDRYNFRFNSEHKLYKDLITVGQNMTFTYTDKKGVQVAGQYNSSLRSALEAPPTMVDNRKDTVGLYNYANPVSLMQLTNQNQSNAQKLLGNFYMQIEPIKNLKFRTSVGVDFSYSDYNAYLPIYTLSQYAYNLRSKATQQMDRNKTIIVDNLLSYGFHVNEHQIDLMAGSTQYQYSGNVMYGYKYDVALAGLQYAYLSNATGAGVIQGGPGPLPSNNINNTPSIFNNPYNPNKRESYYGRINYNFKETYLVNATFRADGSSNFAPGHQWGYFPSISAGWVMTNADFLAPTRDWLDFFKLRASWGQVGNQNSSAFNYIGLVNISNTNYNFGSSNGTAGLVAGAYPSTLANPNLKWETSQQTNIGFDARLLSGKLNVNLDWYDKQSKNWLIVIPVLATAGATPPYSNGGNVTNKGLELALAYNDHIGEVNFKIGVNGARNKNMVTDIPTPDHIIHPVNSANQLWNNALEFYRAEAGYPMGYFWGYKTNGVFQTEADVQNYKSANGTVIQPNAKPGDIKYVDRDGNGSIDSNDKTMIGNPNPKYTFGFTVSADYKGFDFSVLANGVSGNQLVQSYRNQSGQYDNYTTAILNRWHGEGTSNTVPRVTADNRNFSNFSDQFIQNGDFLRISNVTLGYNFAKFIPKGYVKQLRVYASVLNLYTFTKYTGMDPEIGSNSGLDPMASGVDLGYYPRPRTYMIGVNVKF